MIALRNRWTKWLLVLAALVPVATVLAMLVHYFGDCAGGYKRPVTCSYLPAEIGGFALNALFFGSILSIVWTPAGLAMALFAELWARCMKTGQTT